MRCESGSCTQNLLPMTAQYFKEELLAEILAIPHQKPNVERALDLLVWPQIESTKIIESPVGLSNEGQYLSGIKLLVEIKINEKLTYVADEPTQGVYAIQYETIKSMFIVLPKEINGKNTSDLVHSGRISVVPYVEDVTFRSLDCRNIFRSVMLFLNVNMC